MIYLIGVIFAILCTCGWLIWYLKTNDEITLNVFIMGIGIIICSWLGVAIILCVALINGLIWLGEKGDSIIVWKKPKEKQGDVAEW